MIASELEKAKDRPVIQHCQLEVPSLNFQLRNSQFVNLKTPCELFGIVRKQNLAFRFLQKVLKRSETLFMSEHT